LRLTQDDCIQGSLLSRVFTDYSYRTEDERNFLTRSTRRFPISRVAAKNVKRVNLMTRKFLNKLLLFTLDILNRESARKHVCIHGSIQFVFMRTIMNDILRYLLIRKSLIFKNIFKNGL